jgi:hypothetical protein
MFGLFILFCVGIMIADTLSDPKTRKRLEKIINNLEE